MLGLMQVEVWILGSRKLRTESVGPAKLFAESGERVIGQLMQIGGAQVKSGVG